MALSASSLMPRGFGIGGPDARLAGRSGLPHPRRMPTAAPQCGQVHALTIDRFGRDPAIDEHLDPGQHGERVTLVHFRPRR